ncbi:MAG: hypothetical protein QOE70_1349 [Chthoniobacter sp.]|jgi:hypothetical protein|nr:hypothetical protein [Chthoniobacter sp.]
MKSPFYYFDCGIVSALCFVLAVISSTSEMKAQDAIASNRDMWLGINHGDVDQPILLSDLQKIGLHMVREGFNGKPDRKLEAKVSAYVDAGIEPHVSINMRGSGINVTDYPAWLQNYKQRCIEIMTAYKGKLHYYIVGNETDKADPFTGRLTPEQAVDFTRMAYEASRQVDPTGGIKIESAPISSPRPIKDYLKKMFAAGLNDHCDYIGVHVYSNQINDGKLDYPWILEQQQGGTQKPIAISEIGVSMDWAPKTFSPEQKEQWKSDFLDQAYVQLKRYGIANAILFESSSSSKWPDTFAILRDGTTARNILPTTYKEVQNHFKPRPLQNVGFENTNDPKRLWVVYDDPADDKWDTSAFDFQAAGGHSGKSALQIDTSGKGPRIVRQVVSGITPGKAITITAWAFSNNKAGATLKAEGYNAIAGNAETSAVTKGYGAWEELSVTVTPTNPWVVIELSSTTKNIVGSYVKFDDVTISSIK